MGIIKADNCAASNAIKNALVFSWFVQVENLKCEMSLKSDMSCVTSVK